MTATHAAANPAPASAVAANRWSRWSDWLNPILVREVQQAVKGRTFALLVLAVILYSIGLAVGVASDEQPGPNAGPTAFSFGLMALVPLVLFVVPMQAYHSMRLELRAGIIEQLLLSRLRPRRIIAGKLAAAMVQYMLYLSVLAPVLATTYLLRGIDVPMIAVCLLLSLLACVAATALAIAAACQGTVPMLQPLANLGMAFSLGMLTLGLMGGIGGGDLVRELGQLMRSPEWPAVLSAMVLGALVATVLGGMVASALLAHSFENRATPFRVLLLAVAALAYGWMLLFVPSAEWPTVGIGLAMILVVGGGFAGVFFVSEPWALSPRQRVLVPRSRALALLAWPVLPGRERGLVFVLGYGALLAGIVAVCLATGPTRSFHDGALQAFGFLAAYLLIYLLLVKAVRGLLPETNAASHVSRLSAPLLVLFGCGIPMLIDALFSGGYHGWHVGHALNPFFTMDKFVDRASGDEVLSGLFAFAAVLLLLQGRGHARGLVEVLAASSRRNRSDS